MNFEGNSFRSRCLIFEIDFHSTSKKHVSQEVF